MNGPGDQFVGNLCRKVGIADTAENAQVLIRGCDTVKSDIWAGDADCHAREVIQ
jgi:hypothetical protein